MQRHLQTIRGDELQNTLLTSILPNICIIIRLMRCFDFRILQFLRNIVQYFRNAFAMEFCYLKNEKSFILFWTGFHSAGRNTSCYKFRFHRFYYINIWLWNVAHVSKSTLSKTAPWSKLYVTYEKIFRRRFYILLRVEILYHIQNNRPTLCITSGSYSWGDSQAEISVTEQQIFEIQNYLNLCVQHGVTHAAWMSQTEITDALQECRVNPYFSRHVAIHLNDYFTSVSVLVVVFSRIGHCSHRTSLSYISMKNTMYEY